MSEGTQQNQTPSSSPASAAPTSGWGKALGGPSSSPLEGVRKQMLAGQTPTPSGRGGAPDPTPAASPAPATPPAEPQPAAPASLEGGTPPAAPAPAAPVLQLTPEMMEQMLSRVGQPAASQPEATVSEEEMDQMFNVYKLGAEQLKAALGIEEVSEAQVMFYNNLVQGAAKQAVTVASYALAHQVKQLQEQFAPIMEHVAQAKTEAMKAKFFEQYPNLKGWEPLLMKVANDLVAKYRANGKKFKDENEAFQLVVNDAMTIAKSMGVDTSKLLERPAAGAAPVAGGQTTPQPTPSGMPTLSGGGQGGAGESPNRGGGNKPLWQKALA